MPATSPIISKPRVSIVVPLFNEADVVVELVERLTQLPDHAYDWDLTLVDDGSTDATPEIAERLLLEHGRGRVIRLSRNFGQQAAFRAGLDYADGDAIVLMDGDLQDPPEFIPEMADAWRGGASVVVACRRSRQERWPRRWLFQAFHWLFNKLTDGAMPRDSRTFGLMDRRVCDQVRALHEVSLFLPALRRWPGFRREIVWYDRQARAAGEPKQSLSRLLVYAWDGIVSFSERPLRWITRLGLIVSLCGFAYAGILILQRILQLFGYFQGLEVLGFTTIVVAILCMGGLQLMAIGVVGEYIARIFREIKHRPVFIVDRVMDAAAETADFPDDEAPQTPPRVGAEAHAGWATDPAHLSAEPTS